MDDIELSQKLIDSENKIKNLQLQLNRYKSLTKDLQTKINRAKSMKANRQNHTKTKQNSDEQKGDCLQIPEIDEFKEQFYIKIRLEVVFASKKSIT